MKNSTLENASKLLGISKQSIRLWLRSGHCPFGDAWKGSGKSYIYYINQKRLEEYLVINANKK